MILSRTAIDAIDLSELAPMASDPAVFQAKNEHYWLLAYLSTQVGGHIIDIGTHLGDSALALTYGGRETHSFDVVRKVIERPSTNVFYRLVDLFDGQMSEECRNLLLSSSLILIDVDPHEGTRELSLVRWLLDQKYDGLIVLDDIWYFKPMRDNCWSQIPDRFKADVTECGHWSGTGIVCRDPSRLPKSKSNDNWTLVTGYFDLTGKTDATPELRSRPPSHYLDVHGRATLAMPNNLVVFCDPELEEKVWSLRPEHLRNRTLVIPYDFESFPLSGARQRIIENRGGQGACSRDPRNTASYYLFCMARYAMLRLAIDANAFDSSHFAWVNVCIERMGWKNLVHFQNALAQDRDGFSTCWIDYISKGRAQNWHAHFGEGGCQHCAAGCSMCSGFFTGSVHAMRQFCLEIEQAFCDCLGEGYGHADEQLFPIVYYRRPELFDWYVGDYAEMVTNYTLVRERPEQPLRNLIAHALEAGDKAVARRACAIMRKSVEAGVCSLGEELVRAEEACR